MAKELKVFFSLESLSENYGGPVRSIARLQTILKNQNIESGIIQTSLSITLGEPFKDLSSISSFWTGLHILIKRLIKNEKSIVVFNNQWTFCVQILAFFCVIFRIPYIWWVRGVPSFTKNLKKYFVWYITQKYLMSNSKLIICSSQKGVQRIRLALPNYKSQIIDIPNIIDFNYQSYKSSDYLNKIVRDNLTVNLCSVGRFHPSKRVMELVKKCPLEINGKRVKLTLAGYTSDLEYINLLKDLAKQRSLDLLIKDNASSTFIDELHKNSDIFVSLSEIENFGNAIADALAHGLPVVINDKTDFWPNIEFSAIFLCSDHELELSIEKAMAFAKKYSLSERKHSFRKFWVKYNESKHFKLLNFISSFNSQNEVLEK